MNTVIYLIRHGEVDNPLGVIYATSVNVKLSRKGRKQLENLGRKLEKDGVVPEIIYSSPLTRTRQSAREIAKSFPGIKIVYDKRLQDVHAPGIERLTISWLDAYEDDVYYRKTAKLRSIEIEQPQKQAQRVISVIKEVLQKYRGKTVFVVSHGDPTVFAIWRLLNPQGDFIEIAKRSVKQKDYLRRGEAWKVVFNQNGEIIEREHIKINI